MQTMSAWGERRLHRRPPRRISFESSPFRLRFAADPLVMANKVEIVIALILLLVERGHRRL